MGKTLYSLKALEQDGWIDFNERNYSPSTLVFTTNKTMLYEFEKSHPEHEVILTTLLRSYGGIFDFPSFISENLLARLLKKEEPEIKSQLQKIVSFGVISYAPQSEEPQIIFRKHRVPAEDLIFNLEPYNKRKDAFVQRVQNIISYAKSTTCRSYFINLYFGDEEAKPCGICDNCLNALSKEVSAEEFQKFSAIIYQTLQKNSLSTENLLKELKGLKKEKAWKIIEFLQTENKIEVDEKGLLQLV